MAKWADSIRSTVAAMDDVATLIDNGAIIWGGTAGGTADALTITTSPTIATYNTGQRFAFIVASTNTTTTPSINPNAAGSTTIKRWDGSACIPGDLYAGMIAQIVADGSNYRLMNPACVWTTWTPTFTGFSANPSSPVATYCVTWNRICHFHFSCPNNGTSSTTAFTVSAPLTAATRTNAIWGGAATQVTDNGAVTTTPGAWSISSAGTSFTVYKNSGLGAATWTAAAGKGAYFSGFYEV